MRKEMGGSATVQSVSVKPKTLLEEIYLAEQDLKAARKAVKLAETRKQELIMKALDTKTMDDGRLELVEKEHTDRDLDREKFIEVYPDVFMKIAKIPLTEADAALGKDVVNSLCDISKSYTYSVQLRKEAV